MKHDSVKKFSSFVNENQDIDNSEEFLDKKEENEEIPASTDLGEEPFAPEHTEDNLQDIPEMHPSIEEIAPAPAPAPQVDLVALIQNVDTLRANITSVLDQLTNSLASLNSLSGLAPAPAPAPEFAPAPQLDAPEFAPEAQLDAEDELMSFDDYYSEDEEPMEEEQMEEESVEEEEEISTPVPYSETQRARTPRLGDDEIMDFDAYFRK
jgi:hypothetical protein